MTNADAWREVGFNIATLKDVIEMFDPKLISIENNDYRGCPPASKEKIYLWYRGTDVMNTEVDEIEVDGDCFRCTLRTVR